MARGALAHALHFAPPFSAYARMQAAFSGYAVQQGWPNDTVTTVRATEFLTNFFVGFLREHGYHCSSSYYNNQVSALHDLYRDQVAKSRVVAVDPASTPEERARCAEVLATANFAEGVAWVAFARACFAVPWSLVAVCFGSLRILTTGIHAPLYSCVKASLRDSSPTTP